MPLRRQEIRAKKNVTLGETRNWIAFDDFNGPPLHDEEARAQIFGEIGNVEILEIEAFHRLQLLEEADDELFAALRDGEVRSCGRFSDQLADNSVANNWRERTYTGHSNTRVEIPADFWELEGVDWEGNRNKAPNGEFVDIILNREEVLATWPREETQFEEAPDAGEDVSQEYIPPYVAFMLRAVREMGLQPGTRIQKETIECWLRENWPDDLGGLSKRKVESMATFLRHPADQRGGYFKHDRDK